MAIIPDGQHVVGQVGGGGPGAAASFLSFKLTYLMSKLFTSSFIAPFHADPLNSIPNFSP